MRKATATKMTSVCACVCVCERGVRTAKDVWKKERRHPLKKGLRTRRSSIMRFPRVRRDASEVSMLHSSGAAQ